MSTKEFREPLKAREKEKVEQIRQVWEKEQAEQIRQIKNQLEASLVQFEKLTKTENGDDPRQRQAITGLPAEGFVRLNQIIGDKRRGILGVLPISRAAWYAGIKSGLYPAPHKPTERTAVWRVEDIRELLAKIAA